MDALPKTPPGLSGPQVAALEAIVRAPMAWSSLAGLAWCLSAVESLIGTPEKTSYLVRWSPPGTTEALVTLTPWGAERCGVDLDEIGFDEHPIWGEALAEDPADWPRRPIRMPAHPHEARMPRPDLVVDPHGQMSLAWDTPQDPAELMRRLKRHQEAAKHKFGNQKRRKAVRNK
jgi:hypothetical protein